MLGLVFGALRARAAQAWAVFVLAVLLVTAAAAGPWFAAGAERRAALAGVQAAPAAERTLSVRRQSTADGDPRAALAAFRDTVERHLSLRDPAAVPVLGVTADMVMEKPGFGTPGGAAGQPAVPVAYREDACAHLQIDGRCPQAAGELLLSGEAADALGVRAGDAVVLRKLPGSSAVPATVVGRYELADPSGAYWADPLFRADAAQGGPDPVFTAVDTFASGQFSGPTLAYTTELPAAAFADPGVALGDRLRQADYVLGRAGLTLVASAPGLVARVAADRAAIRQGALAATAGAVVLGWFALALAGRQTAADRRGDAALLRLRGGSRRRALRLGVGQPAIPLLAGLPTGLALGALAGRLLGGPGGPGGTLDPAALLDPAAAPPWWTALLAALAAVLGGLAALAVAELAALRAPVAALLRRVPGPGRARRAAADAVLVVLAGFAAAQFWGSPLRTVVPVLLAVVIAVAAARLLAAAAARAGSGALRAGRLRLGLTALRLSRQPGADRLLALVAVAVAGLAAATGGYLAGFDARSTRAEQELGAPRVLTVRAANPTALLAAVRRADPGGRDAMAAVVDRTATPPVLAVDAARLGAVATWRPEYGPAPSPAPPGPAATTYAAPSSTATPGSTAAPATGVPGSSAPGSGVPGSSGVAGSGIPGGSGVPGSGVPGGGVPGGSGMPPPSVSGAALVLRARNDGAVPVSLAVTLQNTVTGRRSGLTLGPLPPGEHEATAPVAGCAEGCRLVRFDLLQPRPAASSSAGFSSSAGASPSAGSSSSASSSSSAGASPSAGASASGGASPSGGSSASGGASPSGGAAAGAQELPGPEVAVAVLTITELRQEQPAATVLDAALLGDPRQWRAAATGRAMQVNARRGGLTLSLPAPAYRFDGRVFLMAAGLPLPAVLAGPAPASWRLGDATLDLFGGGLVPVHVAGTAPLLPVLGAAGVLVDLDAAQRLSAVSASAGTYQVWLADGAAPGIVERLAAAGLTVVDDDSVDARAGRFAARGPAVAARFGLFGAVLGLLGAAAALAVAIAAARRSQDADLRALRRQGLPARVAAGAARAGSGAVVLAGVATGLLAAVVGRFAAGPPLPYFADGWRPPAPPEPLPPSALLAAGVAALLLLALVWRLATAGGRPVEEESR